ncbi:MAG: hypothetical protein B7X08_02295 [Acidocella sp. 20-63-7]|nr:MAG: hypothetical protein B7X08_02295 [Acidocella sp. 20-63-7]HQT45878.1 peptidoglycan DD-metalloendopeptidase family protein [Acidocella sp.]
MKHGRMLLALFLAASPLFAAQAEPAKRGAQSSARAELAAQRQAEADAKAHARADAARAALLAEQEVEAAAALRTLENQTSQDEQKLADLQSQQAAAGVQLQAAEKGLETLLPVMQRLAAQPAATLLTSPQSPADAVRSIAIIQGIATSIETQAETVKTLSGQLDTLLATAQAARTQLDDAAAAQARADAALQSQINAAKGSELEDADAATRAAEASLEAQNKLTSITSVVNQLSAPGASLPAGTGGRPVAGRIVQHYGSTTLAGPAQGVTYSAVPGARVTTPCAGKVIFSGPFRSYGLVVIADCGGGTSVVLAGLNQLDVVTGQQLAHGQPVGSMLGDDKASRAHHPFLYVELRQNGSPIDPTSWLHGGGSG